MLLSMTNHSVKIFFFREPYNANPILIATLSVIKGYPTPVDIVRIETISEVLKNYYKLKNKKLNNLV